MMEGVSFVVPVRNGAAWIADTLEAIAAQADGRPMEIIVVDDRSGDESETIVRRLSARWPLHVLKGEGRGAAAAINQGVRAALHPIVCQVDQDVIIGPGWMRRLASALADPIVGAAQGYYETDGSAGLCARAMSLDLEQRYAAIAGEDTGHVCTGNTAYRAAALDAVGLFDETLGYGYDNDISYRLHDAGYRLALCRDARSTHRWREGFAGYLRQQYGFGYGRLDLVAKHPRRLLGDSVSPAAMMLHPMLAAAALSALAIAALTAAAGGQGRSIAVSGVSLLAVLALERFVAGVSAARRFRTLTPLVFPLLHLGRDFVWVAAMIVWTLRRVAGRRSNPEHSMQPRPGINP
jgi:hypothetical protein